MNDEAKNTQDPSFGRILVVHGAMESQLFFGDGTRWVNLTSSHSRHEMVRLKRALRKMYKVFKQHD